MEFTCQKLNSWEVAAPGLKPAESGYRTCSHIPSTHCLPHIASAILGIPDYFITIDLKIKHIGTLFLKNNFLFINRVYHQ